MLSRSAGDRASLLRTDWEKITLVLIHISNIELKRCLPAQDSEQSRILRWWTEDSDFRFLAGFLNFSWQLVSLGKIAKHSKIFHGAWKWGNVFTQTYNQFRHSYHVLLKFKMSNYQNISLKGTYQLVIFRKKKCFKSFFLIDSSFYHERLSRSLRQLVR